MIKMSSVDTAESVVTSPRWNAYHLEGGSACNAISFNNFFITEVGKPQTAISFTDTTNLNQDKISHNSILHTE